MVCGTPAPWWGGGIKGGSYVENNRYGAKG